MTFHVRRPTKEEEDCFKSMQQQQQRQRRQQQRQQRQQQQEKDSKTLASSIWQKIGCEEKCITIVMCAATSKQQVIPLK